MISLCSSALLEQLAEKNYQACLIDPEGDYDGLHGIVVLGNEKHAPEQDQIAQAMQKLDTQVAVNLMGMPLEGRPSFFSALFSRLEQIRVQTGRPHWIVIDEAHHMLPAEWVPASAPSANELKNLILITVHPGHVAPAALRRVNVIVAIGGSPENAMLEFARVTGVRLPERMGAIDDQRALVWMRDSQEIRRVQLISPTTKRQRHKRNYAVGELGEEQSFYFRGADGRLNLRAQNLMLFLQIAEGVDDETWEFHLRNSDYSTWFRNAIKGVLCTSCR